jgi:hypothetical protein
MVWRALCLHLQGINKYRLGECSLIEKEIYVHPPHTPIPCTDPEKRLLHSLFLIGSDRAPASLSCPWLWLMNRLGSQQLIPPLCLYNTPPIFTYTLKMKVAHSFETLIPTYMASYHNLEDHSLNFHCSENFKTHTRSYTGRTSQIRHPWDQTTVHQRIFWTTGGIKTPK